MADSGNAGHRVCLRPIRRRPRQAQVVARPTFRTNHVEDVRRPRRAHRASRPRRQQGGTARPSVAEHLREREQSGASDFLAAAGSRSATRERDFLVTVPGHGYRFVAPVKAVQDLQRVQSKSRWTCQRAGTTRWHDGIRTSGALETEAGADEPILRQRGPEEPLAFAGSSSRRSAAWSLAIVAVGDRAAPREPSPHPQRTLHRITYDEAVRAARRGMVARWSMDGVHQRPRRERRSLETASRRS